MELSEEEISEDDENNDNDNYNDNNNENFNNYNKKTNNFNASSSNHRIRLKYDSRNHSLTTISNRKLNNNIIKEYANTSDRNINYRRNDNYEFSEDDD